MAHPELDCLAEHCFKFAKAMRAKHGEFSPFAYAIRQEDGGAARVHAEELAAGLRALANRPQVSSVALCTNNRITLEEDPGRNDAIVVGLEHIDGESVDVLLPYRKRRFLGYS